MTHTDKYKFNGEVITLDNTLFDSIVFDFETSRIKEVFTLDEEIQARLNKAQYLLDIKQIELVEVIDVEVTDVELGATLKVVNPETLKTEKKK